MASIINALSSGTGGIVTSGDASGILQLQTANTAAVTIDGSQNVGIGTTSPVAKQHIKGSGTSGQTTASLIVENGSSGTIGLDITGTAGSSYARLRYGGGPGTGTNSMTGDVALIGLEGSSIGFQQIKFAPTQSASSDANTLDDYEEGTWTPVFVPATGSITTQSGSGRYTKIGNMVILTGTVTVTTWGTAGGSVNVTSLPFGFADNFSGNGSETNISGKQCSARWNGVSSTQFAFNYYDNGGLATVGGNGAGFNFSATYRT
jgi:hypothetical protein